MLPTVILFDGPSRNHLLPLTYSRPVADLRFGILTLAEKWAHDLQTSTSFCTRDYLRRLYPCLVGEDNLVINGDVIPTAPTVAALRQLEVGQGLVCGEEVVAMRLDRAGAEAFVNSTDPQQRSLEKTIPIDAQRLTCPGDIFAENAGAIQADFARLTAGRSSAPLPASNILIGPPENVFLEDGASVQACVINAEAGPVYFAAGATAMEGCLLRGPLSVGAGATLKMGAKIYGATTIGPLCKVGGEVNNVIFQAHSNKGHDGFLGNAVIGEWCNLGADTNCSNLKNDYGEVKVWSYPAGARLSSGRQFHGLVLGDHSKVGINTMFNTGTVAGFATNVFGGGFPPTFIPSFSWGGTEGFVAHRLDKALATAARVMARRKQVLGPEQEAMFTEIFTRSEKWRNQNGEKH